MMEPEIRIRGIKIVGPFFDGSGYAKGARNWVRGLYQAKVPIYLQPISFEKDRPLLTSPIETGPNQRLTEQQFLEGLIQQGQHDINFVRLSPEVAVNFLEPGVINICSCAWETSRLDPYWVECLNRFQGVFVESEWLVGVFRDSGVKPPIFCVPNCVDVSLYVAKTAPNLKDVFKFYSVQQWTERKNGLGLLKAYFNAFTDQDDVLLVLKTYLTRVEQNVDHFNKIKSDIESLKRAMNLKRGYPRLYLVTEKLTDDELIRMHEECDCYVMLDRGEGFGLPYIEAAAAGNTVIGSAYGGTRQFLNDNNSIGIPGQETFVCNMEWSDFYHADQLWFEPDLVRAAEAMRAVFDQRQEAFEMGQQARRDMEQYFNRDAITKTLLSAIVGTVRSVVTQQAPPPPIDPTVEANRRIVKKIKKES
jgi:glycosyltransferase involved in cell wall biosynthesis